MRKFIGNLMCAAAPVVLLAVAVVVMKAGLPLGLALFAGLVVGGLTFGLGIGNVD